MSNYSVSFCSMKNNREIAKYQTFNKIITSAKEVIIKKGIINLKTLDVAKKANIAHGTLFSHFQTKDVLVSEICQTELKNIAVRLKEITRNQQINIASLLEKYLSLVAENEAFYIIIAKEFPFLSKPIQESIISNEVIIRNILYQKIENGNYNVANITMTISFFFATVNYYLSRKEYFESGKGGLMNEKKNDIISTFLKLLTKRQEK